MGDFRLSVLRCGHEGRPASHRDVWTQTEQRVSLTIRLHKGLSHSPLQSPSASTPWGDIRMKKDRMHSVFLDKGTHREDAYLGANFSDPRFLHLLIHGKTLKSLTWDICSVWLTVIALWLTICTSQILPAQKIIYIYTCSSPTSSEQILISIWQSVSSIIVLGNTETHWSYIVLFSFNWYFLSH